MQASEIVNRLIVDARLPRAGDDRFEMGPVPQPGTANDQINAGGTGRDTLSYAERTDPVIVNWDVDLLRGRELRIREVEVVS